VEKGIKWIGQQVDFPNCLGSMDGKHVQILAPRNSGSSFFNYKGNFSVVFFAVVDANYKVIYADMRCQGCISDGWMFAYTALCTKLEEKQLCVPISRPLPGRINAVEFVFVADDAFALSANIMQPFRGQHPK
jgi:hypothetical protein